MQFAVSDCHSINKDDACHQFYFFQEKELRDFQKVYPQLPYDNSKSSSCFWLQVLLSISNLSTG